MATQEISPRVSDRLFISEKGTKLPGPHLEASPTFWDSRYFPVLDSLRVLSLFLVIAMHTRTSSELQRYLNGHFGLDIFFVISGFLITTILLREEVARKTISLSAFYIRRTFRILPAYVLALGAYFIVGKRPAFHDIGVRFMRGLPYFLTLRNEYVPRGLDIAFGHSWSLSVEEKFYLLWPVVYFIAFRRLKARWLAFALPLIMYLLLPEPRLFVAYFAILCGCGVAIFMHAYRCKPETLTHLVSKIPVVVPIMLWIAIYLFADLTYPAGTLLTIPMGRIGFDLATAMLFPILLLSRSRVVSLLSSAPATFVGKRTYSMYLFHAIVLNAVENHLLHPRGALQYLAVVATAFLIVFLVAQVIYVTVERPMIRVGHRLSKKAMAQ